MGLQNEDEIWCGRAWIPRSYCSSVSGLALQLGDAISVPAQNTSTAGSMLRWVRNFGLDFVLSAGTRRDSGGLVAVGFIDIDTRNVAVFFFPGARILSIDRNMWAPQGCLLNFMDFLVHTTMVHFGEKRCC